MIAPAPITISRGSPRPPRRGLGARAAVLAAAVITAGCVAVTVAALATGMSPGATRGVLVCVTAGVALMLGTVVLTHGAAAREAARQASAARALAVRGQADVEALADLLLRGGRPADAPAPPPFPGPGADQFQLLMHDLEQGRHAAGEALLRVTGALRAARTDQRVEIFVNLAGRMQSLAHRAIVLLEALENQVEDPVLLNGLYDVDHLATRMRRQSESLAVVGGEVSLRQWSRHMSMQEVLRAAAAEVEQYARVKVERPAEGMLRSTAVTDVIHLIAELVENATKFSRPSTQVLLRSQVVTAGVAVEVEDRGLGMTREDQQRMNDLLADPGGIDVDELLRGGRIGLYVVAALARRHGIVVRLQPSIYGGVMAAVILPPALLAESGGPGRLQDASAAPRQRELSPADRQAPGRKWDRLAALAQPGMPQGAGVPQGARVPLPEPPRRVAPADAGRPTLPERQPQASLAPELRHAPGDAPTAGQGQPTPGLMPGLAADFLSGVRLSEADDRGSGR
ncbi:MAG: rane protein [Actinomycetia bacterium]|nr:rane protein [Actinomycetes bacterium]